VNAKVIKIDLWWKVNTDKLHLTHKTAVDKWHKKLIYCWLLNMTHFDNHCVTLFYHLKSQWQSFPWHCVWDKRGRRVLHAQYYIINMAITRVFPAKFSVRFGVVCLQQWRFNFRHLSLYNNDNAWTWLIKLYKSHGKITWLNATLLTMSSNLWFTIFDNLLIYRCPTKHRSWYH